MSLRSERHNLNKSFKEADISLHRANGRYEHLLQSFTLMEKELREAREELLRMRKKDQEVKQDGANTAMRADLNIPLHNNEVVDKVLIFKQNVNEQHETECYKGADSNITCLHLTTIFRTRTPQF